MMTVQRFRSFLPFVLGQRTTCRTVASLMLMVLLVMGLPALSGAQTCLPDGDVDQNGSVTAQDALLAFQQALSLVELDACQLMIADVAPLPTTPDGNVTALDALCIFQKALSLPSCLDTPANQLPVADAGMDQSVDAGAMVTLVGTASSDADGTIASYAWAQTGGTMVALSGDDSDTATFTAPNVAETLTFRLTVTDNQDATASDEVSVTVQVPIGNQPPTVAAVPDQTVDMASVVMLMGSGSDSDGDIASYQWTQTAGPPVSLSLTDQALTSFTAPIVDAAVTLTFQLTVTDDDGAMASGEVSVTVRAPQPFVLDMSELDDPRYRLQ